VQKHLPLLKQLFFYGVVGVITLGIDLTVTTSLYDLAHLPAGVASAIGFMSGFFFNFPINRKKVFHHSKDDRFSLHTQVVLFVSLSLFNLLITSTLVELFVSHHVVRIAVAKLIVTAMIALWNFIIFKTLIFSKTKPSHGLDERVLNDII
jgi:putative flippase GtrA